jgi:lysophospholipase L1-like esterase
LISFGVSQADAMGALTTGDVAYYLALGGSGSIGFQPTVDHPKGQPTHVGYANDLLTLERVRWSGLQLVQLGCPGETTGTFLSGGDRCRPNGQTQLAQAVSFLRSHANTVLVTIDVGFNNIRPCLAHHVVNETCVSQSLVTIRQQLTEIVSLLRAAVPSLRMVGVGHYDPYLKAQGKDVATRAFAQASIAVTERLNATLSSVYSAAGVPMANVASAFAVANAVPATLANGTTVPRDVVRLCALTWVCVAPPLGHNQHPNEDGYEVIAEAIADVVRT